MAKAFSNLKVINSQFHNYYPTISATKYRIKILVKSQKQEENYSGQYEQTI